jgi:hypothetical protein
MSADKYFQFPLSLLALGANEKTRLGIIFDYCIVTVGHATHEKITSAERSEILAGF